MDCRSEEEGTQSEVDGVRGREGERGKEGQRKKAHSQRYM